MPSDPTDPQIIDGYYAVQAELGRGGMARVYRVIDQRSGQELALKQLFVDDDRRAVTLRSMFEREYHTLVQLAHPRIVRAFEYGTDNDRPYYTMELLEGTEARETLRTKQPEVREICLWLRDAASALALIHSRRLIHRDISPRNLWCTPDGRGKLIDFGTLVAMGPQTQVVGTPPFVPPEAVYMQPLDARSDLYALGALAFFLLTGRNAYPAREITDLPMLWQRRPQRPDAINPQIPRPLSDLVMALLSVDARGRPATAAEVFDRLTAIGELSVEDERHLAQAFLTTPKLVGRDTASALLRKRLLRLSRDRGGVVSIVAAAGLGRSRMLASLVLEAKLTGATPLAVDATAVGSGPFAVAGALAERLFELIPTAAMQPAANDNIGALGMLSPALQRVLGDPGLDKLSTAERARKLSAGLLALIESASRQRRLMIAIDNVHRADSESLGVLGRLSVLASEQRFLLVTSCDEAVLSHLPPALEQLVKPATRIVLGPLSREHTHELLGSLFGAIPGLDEAADWLHDVSQGSPQTCLQYAQYLVDQGLARYEGGHWKLPEQLRQHRLPATVDAMLESRLATLSEDARTLALGLALARDESRSAWQPESHVRNEDFPMLLEAGDAARTFSALDELVRAGVVEQRDSYYVLVQRAMVDALLRTSSDDVRKRAHMRVAAIFEQPSYGNLLACVRQLQRAGEHDRARRQLVEFAQQRTTGAAEWGAMRISVTAECSVTALAAWQQQPSTPLDGIILRRLLLLTCGVFDWSLARFSDAQLTQLQTDAGLDHWPQTDAAQPALHRSLACLKFAQERYDQTPEAQRGLGPIDAVRELASCAMVVSGAFENSYAVARAQALPGTLLPIRPLSPLVELIDDFCQLSLDRVTGRDIGDRLLTYIQRLLESTLPELLRMGAAAVHSHRQAVEDASRGRARSLTLIEPLAAAVGDDMFLVVHARWLGNAFLGRAALAQKYCKQAEVTTEDDVWRRKAFLFVEAQLFAITGHLPQLARTGEAIAELAAQFEGWRPWLAWTRAQVQRLRGELDDAETELEAALALAQPGQHRAWLLAAPSYAELLLLRGDADGALREAQAVLQTVAELSLDPTATIAALRVRALAESRQQQHAAARASIERALLLAGELDVDGLPLAVLCEAETRIALGAKDAALCVVLLTKLRKLIEHADAPALVNAYEALREESSRQLDISELPAGVSASRTVLTDASEMFTHIQTRLGAFDGPEKRAQQALTLLFEETGAQAGQLFLLDKAGLRMAASVDPGCGDDELRTLAQQFFDSELGETETEAITMDELAATGAIAPSLLSGSSAKRFTPVLLSDYTRGAPLCTGVALLAVQSAPLRTARGEVVHAISRCLHNAGDTVPVALDS